jgi:hypothetical protein
MVNDSSLLLRQSLHIALGLTLPIVIAFPGRQLVVATLIATALPVYWIARWQSNGLEPGQVDNGAPFLFVLYGWIFPLIYLGLIYSLRTTFDRCRMLGTIELRKPSYESATDELCDPASKGSNLPSARPLPDA